MEFYGIVKKVDITWLGVFLSPPLRVKIVRPSAEAVKWLIRMTQTAMIQAMALHRRSSASHNKMLGQQIRHPPSTNFEDGLETPVAKRLKRLDSEDSSLSRTFSEEDDATCSSPRRACFREIPDSEAESDDGNIPPSSTQKTNLESTLPPTKTDNEAIAEYEETRAAESEGLDLRERLGQRMWVPGKSSIYVDAFNLALETVLHDEAHLFDEAEMAVFDHWKSLSYEGQYLYVRLFLRKTAAWHRINQLRYFGDIVDIAAAAGDLFSPHSLPAVPTFAHFTAAETQPPENESLGACFKFADSSERYINTMEDASSLLKLDELKGIAKEAKVQGKNKGDLLNALRRTSQAQAGLGWVCLKRSNSEDSITPEMSTTTENETTNEREGVNVNRDSHFLRKILTITGPCIRLSSAPLRLFERVHLVFYRSTEWTDKSLTTIILSRITKRYFPKYIVSRSTNIFPSRSTLLEFEASIRAQFRVDDILEFSGTTNKDGLQKIKDIFEELYPRWRVIMEEEQDKEDRIYESGEGAYLRRFSPAWVYTRIMHKGTYVLGRFKEHKREHQMLVELLAQHLFHAARRGAWYQRKALLEEHYMWALESDEGRSEAEQKKYWKRIALRTCEDGLQDRDCHLIYHYDLQKRIMKLEKSLKVAKRQQHEFGHVLLSKAIERTVEGTRIEKVQIPRRGSSRRESDVSAPRRGGKTIWADEREGGGECSVEAMCLSWYRDQGWKGYHSEGGIVRTLFGYLFYDVLFTYVPNVFQTAYQTCPLDLHTDAFYPSRASEINHRLMEIANGDAERLVQEVYNREYDQHTCVVGIDWSFEIADLLDIVRCFDGEALATVCKVVAQEYQQRGGGIPDLFLWHPERREVMFSEVKSENDRLSDPQRLWIHVLTGAGIKVELCNAMAKEVVTKQGS